MSEAEVTAVINSQVKQRRDSIVEFKRANRSDMVQQEQEELTFLLSFLPPQLTAAELQRELESILGEAAAAGPTDFGRVMKAAMAKLAGRADGKEVSRMVKEMLGGGN